MKKKIIETDSSKTIVLNVSKNTHSIKIEFYHSNGAANLNLHVGIRHPVDFDALKVKASSYDVIIYVGGLSSRLEGEEMEVNYEGFLGGDKTNIEIPIVQQQIIKALKETGKSIIYVLCTGSALALNYENENIDSIINAWYGGQSSGTALAEVIFGDYNPAGRLPITFYKNISDLPDFEDYNMTGRTYRYFKGEVLYPFGHGLSYTTFEYSQPQINPTSITTNQDVNLTFELKNTGEIDGDEVVQIYIKYPNHPEEPIKALKGFRRVNIKAGKTTTLNFTLEPKTFQTFNVKSEQFEVVPGQYQILIGGSSADSALQSINITIT